MNKLFNPKTGDPKWNFIILITALFALISLLTVGKDILYGFTHRFGRAGIWTLVGIALFAFLFIQAKRYCDKHDDQEGAFYMILAGWLVLSGALLGPAVGLHQDRLTTVPDVQVYYANGRVINPTEENRANFYFKHFKVSPEDSVYITVWSEEPGYNKTRADIGGSQAPRADEDWDVATKRENIRP